MPEIKMHLLVCCGTGCISSQSDRIVESLKTALKNRNLQDEVKVVLSGCFGFCEKGPIVKVAPDNTFYVQVRPEDAQEIVDEHVLKGRKVHRLLYVDPETEEHIADSKHMGFYKKQMRIALRNCGFIDPENINEYIAQGGYQALGKALSEMTPKDVVEEMKKSGLRGGAAAAFPRDSSGISQQNSRRGRSTSSAMPTRATPAHSWTAPFSRETPIRWWRPWPSAATPSVPKGMVYIRAEYPLAVKRLRKAIDDARETGLLGEDILGTGFSFDIELRYGAGAFVCGEETALIRSLEGERGEPTSKPPFPAEKGFWGKPSNVNNVETFANVPVILTKGADWFASIGTEKSKGTKVFALAGKVNNVGLVEVPMGTTLREVVFDIGGGIRDGKKFKAVQTGGPSGGCLTSKHLDTPIDFDNLIAAGSMMGSGGMIVMDEDNCMVSVAKFYLEFTVDESCGKCTPCRVGNKRLHEILEKITQGHGTEEDLASPLPRADHQGHIPLRPRTDRAEPGALHAGQLLGRIRGPCPGETLPFGEMQGAALLRHRSRKMQGLPALHTGLPRGSHHGQGAGTSPDRSGNVLQVRRLRIDLQVRCHRQEVKIGGVVECRNR
jgi:NADH-quinone oxidoreductase subunit F/NADP-reducing hydrogenase subunit HndC